MNVLEIDNFIKDKNRFFAVTAFSNLETSMVTTDKENYLIMYSGFGNPTWIWTRDNLNDEQYENVVRVLSKFIKDDRCRFTSKKEFYDYLVRTNSKYLCSTDKFLLGFLQAYKLVKPKPVNGIFRRAILDDLDILIEYFYLLMEEEGHEVKDIESVKERTINFINLGLIYVWEYNGKIVSQAEYRLVGNSAKIAGVFTPAVERRKGYCSNTMYELTKLLLDKGYEVFLFTDYNYINSNECYKKIGYEDEGYLVNYQLKIR